MHDFFAAIWGVIQPHLAEVLALIIAGLVAQGVAAVRRWTGVQIGQRHADRLSAAITRAAVLALDRRLTGDAAREMMLEYLRETVPEALAAIAPTPTALDLRAAATLAEVRAGLIN